MKLLLPLAVLLLPGCAMSADPETAASVPARAEAPRAFPAVQAFAEAAVRDGRVPGIAIAVAVGDEPATIVTAGRVRIAEGAPVPTGDSLWRAYSMTKLVTALAAMILVEEGKLDLDQPISDILPEFRTMGVLTDPAASLATRPAARAITLRHLLTHTAGLNSGLLGPKAPAIAAMDADGLVTFALNNITEAKIRPLRPGSLQEYSRRLAGHGLASDPGTRFAYASGLDVTAAMIERASGQSFEAFVEQRVLAPLGMHSTSWWVGAEDVPDFVSSYAPAAIAPFLGEGVTTPLDGQFALIDDAPTSVFLTPPSFPYPGGGLLSSAADFDRFLHMLQNRGLLGGRRIAKAETIDLMTSNLLPEGVTLSDFGPVPPGEPTGFGAGGFVTLKAVDGFGRHRGTYGWDGAAGSRAWLDPARKVRATMMINVIGAPDIGKDFDLAVAADLAAMSQANKD